MMMLFATLSPGTLLLIGGFFGFVLGGLFAIGYERRNKEPR